MSYMRFENGDGKAPTALTEIRKLPNAQWYMWAKRAFDIALAILVLPLIAVLCVVFLVLNPFFNPGPLFFVQTRIGRHEKPFRMIKLRTMTGKKEGISFATGEAHRITPLGAFMRSKRIDELPQFINVLKGDMSFIGPRPEQPEFYQDFAQSIPNYGLRQTVRPGLTGLAQVESGYADDADSTRTKLRYDFRYLRNMSLSMDAYVIGRTVKVLLTGFGAR